MRICILCAEPVPADDWTCPGCGHTPPQREGFVDLAGGTGREGFEEESFAMLARVEERSFWFRARNDLIGWALDRYAPHARSFLEIGCGSGFVLQSLARRRPRIRLVGGEPHPSGLRVASERLPDAELLLLDARRLPFREEFDAAGAFDVLEHIDDDAAVLRELWSSLLPGGVLFVTVPQHRWLWSRIDEYSHHVRRYLRRELLSRVEAAGFEVLRATSFVTILLPVVALSRLRERRSGGELDPGREFAIPDWLDRWFERLLSIERVGIRAGMRLPAGSSLLVVARRPLTGAAAQPR